MLRWVGRALGRRENSGAPFQEIKCKTRDGLDLYARHYKGHSRSAPIFCLAGLTRNSKDFHDFASLAVREKNCPDIYCLDSRGRGRSDHDANWRNYTIAQEAEDACHFLDQQNIDQVKLIGTSRGGLLALHLAPKYAARLRGVIFNDIGPDIEVEGLMRIASYAGKTSFPKDWDAAADYVERMNKSQFPTLSRADWVRLTRQWFDERAGKPVLSYDRNIAKALATPAPLPDLWGEFDSLKSLPVMVLRGENSDILAPATVDKMMTRHPQLVALEIKEQGHAPLLSEKSTVHAMLSFLSQA